ncbi:hypothetical protein HDU77_009102 [Chytriomyces hyalinus]|nr:hypothetical protein HDU77_009102 [Chytriomyces hyalinus]
MTLCHTISSCSDSSDGETAANRQEPGQEQTLRARIQVLESELRELRALRNEHGDLLELVQAIIKQDKEFKEAFKAKAGSRGHFSAMLSQKTSPDSVVTVTPASMEPVVSIEFKRAKVLQAITKIGSIFKSNGPYTQSHCPRVKQANAPVGQGASTQGNFVSFYTFKNLNQETPAKIFSSNTSTTLTNPKVAVETLKLKSKEFMELSPENLDYLFFLLNAPVLDPETKWSALQSLMWAALVSLLSKVAKILTIPRGNWQ